MNTEHRARLGRHLLELLGESPHGLTPPTLLELVQERGVVEMASGRGPYQRILRFLAQFEAQGLIRKVGRRYVLDATTLARASEDEALQHLTRALDEAALPANPDTWLAKLRQLFDRHP